MSPTNGVSSEYIHDREDDMAVLITACDQVDSLRSLGIALRRRDMITEAYYRDLRDTLDCIAAALAIARRNTAMLRRGGAA